MFAVKGLLDVINQLHIQPMQILHF
jgi:hypothetical protein